MAFALTTAGKKNNELKAISKNVKNLKESRQQLEVACVQIKGTNQLMGKVIKKFQESNFSNELDAVESIEGLDDDYKKQVQERISGIKESAINVLLDLHKKTGKMEAQMIASKSISKASTIVLEMQRSSLKAGLASIEATKKLNKEGTENSQKIADLLAEQEKMNGIVSQGLLDFRDATEEVNGFMDAAVKGEDSIESLMEGLT